MSVNAQADRRLKESIRMPIALTGKGYQDFLEAVRRNLYLKDAVDLAVVDQAFTDSGTTVYLRFARDVALRGRELGEAEGIVILSGGTLSLVFDPKGELSSYTVDDNSEETVKEGKQGLLKELQRGRVYFAEPKEKVDKTLLTQQGKAFYVQVDAAGKKRLNRVFL